MKKKQFYDHLISVETIHIELNALGLKSEEKEHLLRIIRSSLHVSILDVVLSNLSTHEKETFLEHVEKDDHDKTWKFLKDKIENIEEKIKESSESLFKEFISDIASLKKRK